MNKRMGIMLICVSIIIAIIVAIKLLGYFGFKHYLATREDIITVSAMKAEYSTWQSQQKYFGSLHAVQGVNVTTELAAKVQTIYFQSGDMVKKGDKLVQLNADSDVALLHSLEANTKLAKITLDRNTAQYNIKAISKATLDADVANYASLKAQTEQQAAIVEKKTIRAPFDGQLGIRVINEGQYLNVGDAIVPLQDIGNLYVDFYVPQQQLIEMKLGHIVNTSIDSFPNRVFKAAITAINPVIDINTRNVQVRATLDNRDRALVDGMFATVVVETGMPQKFITLPQSAISFNSYGEIIYTIKDTGKDKKGRPTLIVTQRFVNTGETRGDQIIVNKGIKAGDLVVTSGQLKLKNGSRVVINNSVVPKNDPAPKPVEG